MKMTIGANIKRLRAAKEITQEQLSVAMNVTCAAVSKWERGETYPDITLLQPLAYYFGVTLDELMGYVDLVMLDIKHIDSEKHKTLTSHGNSRVLSFARYLADKGIPTWIRHVIVDGYTNDPEDLRALGRFIGGLRNVKALDVLPYHALGVSKYKSLGIEYPLEGMPPLEKSEAEKAKMYIIEGIREARRNN